MSYIVKWQALNAKWEAILIEPAVQIGAIWSCTIHIDGTFRMPGNTPAEAKRNAERLMEVLADLTAGIESQE